MIETLSSNHWTIEVYKQRMTTKQWKKILLEKMDSIYCGGRLRQLVAKNLGHGVVEVSKKPIKE
ncbi:MAG: hypothetical protein ACXACY_13325 [Candidatus Hodarchaeales archaeon]